MRVKDITPDTRYTNEIGMWATLRFDPQGGYVPGLGPLGVWYVEHFAPFFPCGPSTMTQSTNRAVCERSLRSWVASRKLPPPVD